MRATVALFPRLARLPAFAVFVLISARVCSAQAFLPPAGEGDVTATYQHSLSIGHLDLNGDLMPGESGRDRVRIHSIAWEAEFGLRDNIAVDFSLPFIAARYEGLNPHALDIHGDPSDIDDGMYHPAFQDFQVGVRMRVKSQPLAITPFADIVIPSHHYPSLAHSAIGKDLRAVVIGAGAGKFLDAVVPGLFFQTQVSYAVVEEVLDIHPNRTRVDGELGYFITPRIAVRFIESYQITQNGLDSILFAGPNSIAVIHGHPEIPYTREYRLNHDRLQRNNFLNLGGGVSFALSDSTEILVAAAKTVWGENVHPLRGLSVGVNWHFRIHGGNMQ